MMKISYTQVPLWKVGNIFFPGTGDCLLQYVMCICHIINITMITHYTQWKLEYYLEVFILILKTMVWEKRKKEVATARSASELQSAILVYKKPNKKRKLFVKNSLDSYVICSHGWLCSKLLDQTTVDRIWYQCLFLEIMAFNSL